MFSAFREWVASIRREAKARNDLASTFEEINVGVRESLGMPKSVILALPNNVIEEEPAPAKKRK